MPLENYSCGRGVGARGTQPIQKAQNDVRLASNVGHGVAPEIRQMPPSFVRLNEGVRRPSTWRERVELKVGWPTVKVPSLWCGDASTPLSLFSLWFVEGRGA